MTPEEKIREENKILDLAENILKASGSSLRNYSSFKIREAILSAAQKGIEEAQREAVEKTRRYVEDNFNNDYSVEEIISALTPEKVLGEK